MKTMISYLVSRTEFHLSIFSCKESIRPFLRLWRFSAWQQTSFKPTWSNVTFLYKVIHLCMFHQGCQRQHRMYILDRFLVYCSYASAILSCFQIPKFCQWTQVILYVKSSEQAFHMAFVLIPIAFSFFSFFLDTRYFAQTYALFSHLLTFFIFSMQTEQVRSFLHICA